jgi:hypothetical protein
MFTNWSEQLLYNANSANFQLYHEMYNQIGICCFLAKHAVLRKKNKDWLARNRYNCLSEGDMSTR